MTGSQRSLPQSNNLLLRVIIGVAIALGVLHVAVALIWGPGPVLAVLPWYAPTMESFGILAALSVVATPTEGASQVAVDVLVGEEPNA